MIIPGRGDLIDEKVIGQADEPETFEDQILKRVLKDFGNAETFMKPFHQACVKFYGWYHNAAKYEDLRKENKFPVPFYQEHIDQFVSYMLDKLFYKDRPCTLVGVEETDKADAEAKQKIFDWQDYKDKIYTKFAKLLRDCAMYRMCVAQVDYEEKKQRRVVGKLVPETVRVVDEAGVETDIPTGGQISKVDVEDAVVYKGPTVKRVDPTDFFIGPEKREMTDEYPVMIRSYHSLDYFRESPLYHNVDKLEEMMVKRAEESHEVDAGESEYNKRMIRGYTAEQKSHNKELVEIEWQGMVDKTALYKYLGKPLTIETDEGTKQVVKPGERTLALVSVVDQRTIVRLEESPFDFQTPNVIVGVIQPDENELIGVSISDKIGAVHQGREAVFGMMLENFKQSVNTMNVIKKDSILNYGSSKTNKAGQTFETNEDVDKVFRRIDPQMVSPDLLLLDQRFEQFGQNADGLQNLIGGTGDKATETLGESQIVATQASLRMNDHLRSVEESLVEPLYQMRNQINMQNLDQEYVYGIIGQGAIEWRRATPAQIRANVDFVCESASRETNRLVITQQILQLGKIAPLLMKMGMPIRFDKLLAKLMEQGFSWSSQMIEEILITLKLEKEGTDIDQLLLENMMLQLNAARLQGLMATQGLAAAGGGGQQSQPEMAGVGGGGASMPEPRSEGEAFDALRQQTDTQIGRM